MLALPWALRPPRRAPARPAADSDAEVQSFGVAAQRRRQREAERFEEQVRQLWLAAQEGHSAYLAAQSAPLTAALAAAAPGARGLSSAARERAREAAGGFDVQRAVAELRASPASLQAADRARELWQRLLGQLPSDSPYIDDLKAAIAAL